MFEQIYRVIKTCLYKFVQDDIRVYLLFMLAGFWFVDYSLIVLFVYVIKIKALLDKNIEHFLQYPCIFLMLWRLIDRECILIL